MVNAERNYLIVQKATRKYIQGVTCVSYSPSKGHQNISYQGSFAITDTSKFLQQYLLIDITEVNLLI